MKMIYFDEVNEAYEKIKATGDPMALALDDEREVLKNFGFTTYSELGDDMISADFEEDPEANMSIFDGHETEKQGIDMSALATKYL